MRIKRIAFLIFVVSVVVAGCNFFSWTGTSPGTGGASYDLTEAGYMALNSGNLEDALSYFEEAIEGNPENSKARLGYAEALLFYKLPEVWQLVNDYNDDDRSVEDLVKIIDALNKPEYRDLILEGGHGGVFKKIVDVLDDPVYSVFTGESDGEVDPKDFRANMLVAIGYMGVFFVNFLDTSGNGVFGDSQDLITINTDGTYTIMQLDEIQSNVDKLTNVSAGDSISEALSNLKALHDDDEQLLGIAKTVYEMIYYLDKVVGVLDRLSSREDIAHFGDLKSQIEEQKSNVVDQKTNIYALVTNMGGILNDIHQAIVGDYAYPSSKGLDYFTPSPWDSHNGGLKKTLEDLAEITNALADTNVSNIIDTITNNFTEEDLSNLFSLLSNLNF